MSESHDLARLRSVLSLAREFGATDIDIGDIHVRLGALAPAKPVLAMVDADEARALSDEERAVVAAMKAEKDHVKKWERITRSSGAPIPAYVAPKAAQ